MIEAIHRAKAGLTCGEAITSSFPGPRQASLLKTKKMVLQPSVSLPLVSSVRGCFSFDL